MEKPQVVVGRDRLRALVHDAQLQMVLQVLAHAREVPDDGNAKGFQQRLGSDAGKLEELRTLQRARADDDFPRTRNFMIDPVFPIPHAGRARPIEEYSGGLCAGFDPQVRALFSGPKVGRRAARAPAVLREQLVVAHAFLIAAVEVARRDNAALVGGGDDRLHQLVACADVRAGGQAALEIRQHLVPAPALVARRGPAVIVRALPAYENQPVDR